MALRALPYVPVEDLHDRPHVLVDGATRAGSVLTLSHWPQSPTPAALARDLSAGIVFAFLHASQGRLPRRSGRSSVAVRAAIVAAGRAEAVTNDHFDEDGLVSVFAMTEPEIALRNEELLLDVASCGDFGVVSSRTAARIAFAIGPLGEQAAAEASEAGVLAERPGSWSGPRYRAVLERTVELLGHPERFRRYWEHEDAALAASEEELRTGSVRIDEVPEVDLAVVTRTGPDTRPADRVAAGRAERATPIHEVALHSATSASRILTFDDGRCELYLRYEGWVRYMSRQVPLRPDLALLGEALTSVEPTANRWVADGVGSIVTRMRPEPEGRTGLDAAVVASTVVAYLKSAPAAWDPFRPGGALVPVDEGRHPK